MDVLANFLDFYLTNAGPIAFVPRQQTVHKVEDVTSVLMFRRGPFQVQMFIAPPNYIIPEHKHPNVDSFEVYMGGQIRFSKHGKWTSTDAESNTEVEGMSTLRGKAIRVYPDDLHGGASGPSGSVFLSVQHWLNGVAPSCVANDYDGLVMGPDHLSKVTSGTPTIKQALKISDAAYLESDFIDWNTYGR